jgi:hypothetical protein
MRARAASARARGARETNPPAFTTIIIRVGGRVFSSWSNRREIENLEKFEITQPSPLFF